MKCVAKQELPHTEASNKSCTLLIKDPPCKGHNNKGLGREGWLMPEKEVFINC